MKRKVNHWEKLRRITKWLKEKKSDKEVLLTKKGVSHQVPKPGKERQEGEELYIGDLNEIIRIDKKRKICVAEPGVTFSELVKETLKKGLVPLLVPELKTITIGGAVAGCSVESTSYKYGGFHDTCLEYEVITAEGKVLRCSPAKRGKVFQMMQGTFGTLGIISLLKFRLGEAKPFIHMVYEHYKGLEEYKRAIFSHFGGKGVNKANKGKEIIFMDGIIHSSKDFVLCLGSFVEEAPYVNSYNWMKIFYKSTLGRKEDYLRTEDYFFRYDADCHWIGRNYGLENPLVRFLGGKFFLGSTKMLKMAKRLGFIFKKRKPEVVVDIFIPFSKWEKFFRFYLREFNYFPLWAVPYKKVRNYEWINSELMRKIKDELFIDLAIYGMKQKGEKNYYKLMEEELIRLNGLKTLISHNFYDKKTFWRIWNRKNYQEVKKLTDPKGVLGELYKRTCGKKD